MAAIQQGFLLRLPNQTLALHNDTLSSIMHQTQTSESSLPYRFLLFSPSISFHAARTHYAHKVKKTLTVSSATMLAHHNVLVLAKLPVGVRSLPTLADRSGKDMDRDCSGHVGNLEPVLNSLHKVAANHSSPQITPQ
jgi:hypothetical protein